MVKMWDTLERTFICGNAMRNGNTRLTLDSYTNILMIVFVL